MRRQVFLPVLILALALPLSAGERSRPSAPARAAHKVERVIDGDTIVVTYNVGNVATSERVRLVGMDSPERGADGFEAARDWLDGLLAGESVYLEWKSGGQAPERDPFGRLLAYVLRAPDGLDLGLEEVREGLARIAPQYPHPREAAYLEAQASARAAGHGLWALPEPPDTRARLPKPVTDPSAGAFAWREAGRWSFTAADGVSGSFRTPLFWSDAQYRLRWTETGDGGASVSLVDDGGSVIWRLVDTLAWGEEKTRDDAAGDGLSYLTGRYGWSQFEIETQMTARLTLTLECFCAGAQDTVP